MIVDVVLVAECNCSCQLDGCERRDVYGNHGMDESTLENSGLLKRKGSTYLLGYD